MNYSLKRAKSSVVDNKNRTLNVTQGIKKRG